MHRSYESRSARTFFPRSGWQDLVRHERSHLEGSWDLPGLVNVYKTNWKDSPCLTDKSTISMAMFKFANC